MALITENLEIITKNYIAGEWKELQGESVSVYNPSNISEKVGEMRFSTEEQAFGAVDAAREALPAWKKKSGSEKSAVLYKMADVLEKSAEKVASLASREMGKPIGEMRGEVMRGVNLLRFYAAEGVRPDGQLIPSSEQNVVQYSRRVPLGVVAIITPWNFPVAIPIWKIAPALICGNTVVWKPAEHGVLTATLLMEIFEEANVPKGVLNLVIGKGRVVGNVLLEKAEIDAVSFTGSTATGQRVAASCAQHNIKYQTEMGGKNAAIVLKDADLEKSVPIILGGAFRSAGQKCTATSRIIVEKAIYPQFVAAIQKELSEVVVNEASENPYLGPVASKSQYETVSEYVELARQEANVIGEGPLQTDKQGYFIQPIVVDGITAEHRLFQEEIFGPVAAVVQVEDFEEAIDVCNDSLYGLSAAIFTNDMNKAMRFLDEVDAGMVRVNQETSGVEYQAPFGGMKWSSSHTREQGQAALDFYSQVKTCAIKYQL